MATHSRVDRVAELIQQEIGRMFVRGLKDPRIGMVTVTGAKVTPDLREAWIYYAVHGDERVRQDTATGLAAAAGYIRRELGKALTTRIVPQLHFVVDEAIDRGERVEQLLQQIKREDKGRSEEPGTGGGERG